jgi:hypothetical protein
VSHGDLLSFLWLEPWAAITVLAAIPLPFSLPFSIITLPRFDLPSAPDDACFRRATRCLDCHGLALAHEHVIRDFLPDDREFFAALFAHLLDDFLETLCLHSDLVFLVPSKIDSLSWENIF